MKIILCTAFILATIPIVKAQPAAGSYGLGGTMMYTYTTSSIKNTLTEMDGDYSSTTIKISPRMGYLISEHFMINISAGFIKTKQSEEYSNTEQLSNSITTDLFYINPFLRISHFSDSLWGIFIDLSLSYGFGEDEVLRYYRRSRSSIMQKIRSEITDVTFSVNPGLGIFIGERILLEASLGIFYFSNTTSEIIEPDFLYNKPKKTDTSIGASFDLRMITFGIMVIL